MSVTAKTMYFTSDNRYYDTQKLAEEAQLELEVSKLLRLNIEGISLRDHDQWIKSVIKNKNELIKLLKEIK